MKRVCPVAPPNKAYCVMASPFAIIPRGIGPGSPKRNFCVPTQSLGDIPLASDLCL